MKKLPDLKVTFNKFQIRWREIISQISCFPYRICSYSLTISISVLLGDILWHNSARKMFSVLEQNCLLAHLGMLPREISILLSHKAKFFLIPFLEITKSMIKTPSKLATWSGFLAQPDTLDKSQTHQTDPGTSPHLPPLDLD